MENSKKIEEIKSSNHQKFIKTKIEYRFKHVYIEDNGVYRIIIKESDWGPNISKSITHIIKMIRENKYIKPFENGYIFKIPDQYKNCIDRLCGLCNKEFTSRRNLYYHASECTSTKWVEYINQTDNIGEITNNVYSGPINNIRQTSQYQTISATPVCNIIHQYGMPNIITNLSNNHAPVNIQNNITLCNLGEENPKWLTSNILFQALSNIPRAIPTLMEKKHFNDAFPENKNLRVDTKRNIEQRLQVFENGRWRMRDSKHTFYRVVFDIYEIICDALEESENNTQQTEGLEALNNIENKCENIIKKQIHNLKHSERFLKKLERIRPIWENFKDKIDSHETRTELWEDLKTLLLDRQLAIEQGYDS
jgi:hypothetical protein